MTYPENESIKSYESENNENYVEEKKVEDDFQTFNINRRQPSYIQGSSDPICKLARKPEQDKLPVRVASKLRKGGNFQENESSSSNDSNEAPKIIQTHSALKMS